MSSWWWTKRDVQYRGSVLLPKAQLFSFFFSVQNSYVFKQKLLCHLGDLSLLYYFSMDVPPVASNSGLLDSSGPKNGGPSLDSSTLGFFLSFQTCPSKLFWTFGLLDHQFPLDLLWQGRALWGPGTWRAHVGGMWMACPGAIGVHGCVSEVSKFRAPESHHF